jgi:hypothetical protein
MILAVCVLIIFGTNNASSNSLFESDEHVTTPVDTVIRIESNPNLGFNFPYFLRIPKGLNQNEIQYLLVETNNTGVNDTLLYHEKEAYLETIRNSLGSSLCAKLKAPFLIPVFPRPAKDWQVYTHALDRDAAKIKSGKMKRLDLQLIAMIENAKLILRNYGITIKDKFLLNGFSASGSFANRFTSIHPELVAGTACGGINAIPILCIAELNKRVLKYPIGTSDFEQLFGNKFDLAAFQKVPQFIYMGQNDTNDAVLFDDAYSKSERRLIFMLMGKTMIPDRFYKCESVYNQNKVNSTFKVYPGIGHETDKQVFNDVVEFFTKIINNQ